MNELPLTHSFYRYIILQITCLVNKKLCQIAIGIFELLSTQFNTNMNMNCKFIKLLSMLILDYVLTLKEV